MHNQALQTFISLSSEKVKCIKKLEKNWNVIQHCQSVISKCCETCLCETREVRYKESKGNIYQIIIIRERLQARTGVFDSGFNKNSFKNIMKCPRLGTKASCG